MMLVQSLDTCILYHKFKCYGLLDVLSLEQEHFEKLTQKVLQMALLGIVQK